MDRLLIWDMQVARLRATLVAIIDQKPGLHQWCKTSTTTADVLTPEVWARFIERVRRGEL